MNGFRVLDLSRVLAGPYCTMVLGDLGGDVIKIESPDGDETRGWGPPFAGGESAYYLCVNRNKRGMVVNFKAEEGRAIIGKIARQSDVLVETFRPGTLSRLSLDFESVSTAIQNSSIARSPALSTRDRCEMSLVMQIRINRFQTSHASNSRFTACR